MLTLVAAKPVYWTAGQNHTTAAGAESDLPWDLLLMRLLPLPPPAR